MIELLNNAAQGWWNWMWPMFWQVSALIAILAVFDLFLRKRIWPQVRYALWLLVILKLILPPTFSLSTSITAPVRTQGVHMLEWLGVGRTPDDSPSVGPGTEMTMHPMDTDIESTSMMDDMMGSEVKSLQQAGSSELTGSGSSIKLYWKVYVMAIWLMGVITLALWATVRLPSLKRLHIGGASSSNLPQWLRLLMTKTAEKLHLRKLPKVVLSQYIASPGVFGTFRPVLVLPADTVHRLSHQRAEHILLHELAHIKRGDLMLNAFYTLLQIVYWFNPLLWPVRRKLQNMREVCCDATVAGILREKTMDYRETILETAKWLLAKPMRRSGIGLLGLVEDSHSLLVRLKWLEKKTWKYRGLRTAAALAVLILMVICILPMAKAERAADADESAPPVSKQQGVTSLHRAAADAQGSVEYVDHFGNEDYLNTCCSVAVSPDGRHLYAAAPFSNAFSVFDRNAVTGYFKHIQTISYVNDMQGAGSIQLSPNGQYAACTSLRSNAVHLFARDRSTGTLALLDKVQSGEDGAQNLEQVVDARFSLDSRFVYVISSGSATVIVYRITNEKQLALVQYLHGQNNCFADARRIIASPDGEYIYVVSQGAGTLVVLVRDRGTGKIEIKQVIKNESGNVQCLAGVWSVTCSPGGRFVYTNARRQRGRGNEAIGAFKRMSDGSLTCIQEIRTGKMGLAGGQEVCTSPDGKHLYAIGTRSNAMAVFRSDSTTGKLTHLQTWSGKKIEFHCSPAGLSVSPDGEYVYVAGRGLGVNGIILLKRRTGRDRGSAYGLYRAACSGDKDRLRSLIEEGTDIHAKQEMGYTPLHWAARDNQKQAAELLLQAGASLDARTNDNGWGWSPLHIAVRRGNREIAAYLIAKGADIEAINHNNRQSPLRITHRAGDLAFAEFLIDKGANVDAENEWGNTLMHEVAMSGDISFGELLCRKGANVNHKQKYGWTPLLAAARSKDLKIVEWLVSRGADVNAKNNWDWTPLHTAVHNDRVAIAEYLIARGANINAEDGDGRTPLWYAQDEGHTKIVELLKKHGAKE